jgi:anaerobic selenocysteine-containing dehydrogenase
MSEAPEANWQATACNLCSLNCGIEIEMADDAGRPRFKRVRGDRKHPSSRGYLCQKASRLDYYQNHAGRLTHPLRRKPDGGLEQIDWETAIREVAEKLGAIRERHGGHAIAYYGGGGQGNHLGGAYAVPFRAALGTPYIYNSLAQEKTGDFWVNGKLFGRQTCHLTEDMEESDFVIVIGANPWQSHGIPRARQVIREIGRDPDRMLVVVSAPCSRSSCKRGSRIGNFSAGAPWGTRSSSSAWRKCQSTSMPSAQGLSHTGCDMWRAASPPPRAPARVTISASNTASTRRSTLISKNS